MAKKSSCTIKFEWCDEMLKLAPEDCKSVFLAVVHYLLEGTPPPEFEGDAKAVANNIFKQIESEKVSHV